MFETTCLACGHPAVVDVDPRDAVYRCDECGALMHYGQRVVVQPDVLDPARPRVEIRLETAEGATSLFIDGRDAAFIVSIARNLLSLVSS